MALAAPAGAETLEALDRFRASAGVFSNHLNIDGRVDGGVAFDGNARDFDEEFNFAHRRALEVFELGWRPFERHELNLRHYRDSRSRSAAIDTELRFAGEVFPVQAEAIGRVAFRALELHYTGWLHATPRRAFGVQVGVLRLAASISIEGEIRNPDLGTARGEAGVSDHLYAPLVGISGRHVLGSNLRLFGDVRAFRLSADSIDGRALSASAGIEYYPFEHLGLVLQYSDTWIEFERSSSRFNGELEVGFSGPQALLRIRW